MRKNLFYNDKIIYEDFIKEDSSSVQHTNRKAAVDINKLLNRVKVNKKVEKKKIVIFFCSGISLLCLMQLFVIIIK